MLTQESFRVERLNGELETANGQLAEARDAEDALNSMVDKLKSELTRYQMAASASEPNTPGEQLIMARTTDNAYAAAPLPPSSFELINDMNQQVIMLITINLLI